MSTEEYERLRSPFPWYGGKSRVADLIWERFGDVRNFIDPFFGSGAVLLARPYDPSRTETVNDKDCFLSNLWRALQAVPDEVARYAIWPVSEPDLHARHRWLVMQEDFCERMKVDPDYYDAKIAGWWLWGCAQWIGTGWCSARFSSVDGPASEPLPALPRGGNGSGPPRQLPHLGNAWMGLHRKLPHLGDAGRVIAMRCYLMALSERMFGVRVACGEWDRVLGPSVTWRHGLTAILLDPPYEEGEIEYAVGTDRTLSAKVRAWAIENGNNPLLRIALCGLSGEHDMPETWECMPWIARGGYGSQRQDGENENRKRERVWYSPHCLRSDKGQLVLQGVA